MTPLDTTRDATRADAGLFMARVIAGLSLALAHGVHHVPPGAGFVATVTSMGLPAPLLFAWLAGIAELGGGLLIAVGLFTRPAALLVAGDMAIIMTVTLAGKPFTEREKPLLFLAVALLCLVGGAGRYSLDAVAARFVARRRLEVSAGRS